MADREVRLVGSHRPRLALLAPLLLLLPAAVAGAGVTLTDTTNITLAGSQTETGGDTSENPDVTGGASEPLVPYTESGSFTCCGASYLGDNLDDGDVGAGNASDGTYAIPDNGALVLDFGSVQTIGSIAIYMGYQNRDNGTYTLLDDGSNVLGAWTITTAGGGTNNGVDSFWLTFDTPVTTRSLTLTATVSGEGTSTPSYRELEVRLDGAGDADSDGLSNLAEASAGTDAFDPDSDDDGMQDGFEVDNGFDPLDSDEDSNSTVDGQDDEDGDGLGNAAEELAGTDPKDSDTDNDGLLDGAEIGTGSFGPQQIISTLADNAWEVVAADVDGDGDTDVLSVSLLDDEVAWYENTDGAGGFGSQQIISTLADLPTDVFAADVDGDGDVDVLSASQFDNEVAWYENTDGIGGFGAQQVISTAGIGPQGVHAADMDGDGDLDVLAASFADDEIAWYENTDGAGGFGAQQVISNLADGAYRAFTADVDGDGDLDVLSVSELDDEVAWYENTDGAGGFGAQQVITTLADGAYWAVAADLDGDGDPDVISASSNDSEVAWYENTDGAGGFGAQKIISTLAIAPQSVFAIDVDGDGDLDVLSASTGDDEIAWYENTDGAGGFGAQQVISNLAQTARSVYAADMDGDGDIDVLSASSTDDEIAWYEQTNVADPLDPDTDDDGMSDGFEVANGFDPLDSDEDSNGTVDGQDDEDSDGLGNAAEALAGTNPKDSDTDDDGLLDGAEIGTGTFGSQQVISTLHDGAFAVVTADIDGDGDLDVLAASQYDDEFAWFENTDGAGSFGAQQLISTLGDGPSSVFAADVDGDGDTDALLASVLDDKIAWYENTDGAGSFGGEQVISALADQVQSIFAADVDGDGDIDVLSASALDDKVAWYENTDGAGSFGGQQVISTLADGAASVFAADLDGDGDLDVLSASAGDDEIAWYENTDGLGSFGTQQVISNLADFARSVFAADLDGDGDSDVLSASLFDDEIAWYENTDGLGTFGAQQVITNLAVAATRVFAADVDGDGDIDVLSSSADDNKIAWYENTDGGGSFGGQLVISSVPTEPWAVFAADVDGDGDIDVLSASLTDNKIAWYPQANVADPLDPDTDDDGLLDGDEVAVLADPLDPDSDDDGICDGGLVVGGTCTAGPDTCPLVSDPGQANSDSLSAGDACQCGDVTDDGIVDGTDLLKAQQFVVGATIVGSFDVTRCNLVGPKDAGVTDCNVADLAVLARQVNGVAMTLQNQIACDAWGAP